MSAPATSPLETLLRQIAAAAPEPWYPTAYAQAAGVPRDSLDVPLDRLRMAGLVRLTDWVKGHGQGYVLTPEGEHVLKSPRILSQLGTGHLPQRREPSEVSFPAATPGSTTWERGEAVREALMQPTNPVVTKALIAANVAVFLLGFVLSTQNGVEAHTYFWGGGDTEAKDVLYRLVLLSEGALRGREILAGQWWRLLTCCFVHIGALHLGVNMYSLYVVGPMLERMWGRAQYLTIYLIAGLGGSCVMLLNDPLVLGAGASGALWGVLASMAIWILFNRKFLPPPLTSAWLRNLLTVFILNVFISVVPSTFLGMNISASAHFGGGAVGAIAAVVVHFQRFGSAWIRRLALVGIVAMPVICVVPVVRWTEELPAYNKECRSKVIGTRDQALSQFNNLVAPALFASDSNPANDVLPPAKRDPESVRKALEIVSREREGLQRDMALLDQCGPYYTPPLLKLQRRDKDYLEACLLLYDASEQALKGGNDWEANAAAVVSQIDAINKMRSGR